MLEDNSSGEEAVRRHGHDGKRNRARHKCKRIEMANLAFAVVTNEVTREEPIIHGERVRPEAGFLSQTVIGFCQAILRNPVVEVVPRNSTGAVQ